MAISAYKLCCLHTSVCFTISPIPIPIDPQREATACVQYGRIEHNECGSEHHQLVGVGHERTDDHLHVVAGAEQRQAGHKLKGGHRTAKCQTERGQMLAAGNGVLHGRPIYERIIVGDVVTSPVVGFAQHGLAADEVLFDAAGGRQLVGGRVQCGMCDWWVDTASKFVDQRLLLMN